MLRFSICFATAVLLHSINSQAAIVPFAEDFATAGGVPSGWTAFADTTGTAPILVNDTGNTRHDDDGSNNAAGTSLDGNSDGALLIDTQSGATDDVGVYFDAIGTMDEGEEYDVTTRFFNPNTSFIGVSVSIENVTDGTVLDTTGQLKLLDTLDGFYQTQALNYTATAADQNDTLRIRYTGIQVNNSVRDFSVDNIQLAVTSVPVPEPTVMMLLMSGCCVFPIIRRRN